MSEFTKSGGVGIMGFLSPMDTRDTYAVTDPIYGIDGLRNVSSVNQLNNIPFERRRAGMIVGVGGGESYYKLKNNSNWLYDLNDWDEIYFSTQKNEIKFSDQETPIGVIDGLNDIFLLVNVPVINSEHIYLNGILQSRGDDNDYLITNNKITFFTPPEKNSSLKCTYRFI
jgi:hypothetical protein